MNINENNYELELIINDFINDKSKNLQFIQFNNEKKKLNIVINHIYNIENCYLVIDNYYEKIKILENFKEYELYIKNKLILMKDFTDIFYELPNDSKFIINNFSNFKFNLENSINFLVNDKFIDTILKSLFFLEKNIKNEDLKENKLDNFNFSRVNNYISIHNNYNFKKMPGNIINNLHFIRLLKRIAFYFKNILISKTFKIYNHEEFLKLLEENIFIKRDILKYVFIRYKSLIKTNNITKNLLLEGFAKLISIIGLIGDLDIKLYFKKDNKEYSHFLSIKYLNTVNLYDNIIKLLGKSIFFSFYFRELEIISKIYKIEDIIDLNQIENFSNINIKIITHSIDQTKYHSNLEDLDKLLVFRNFGNFLNDFCNTKSGGILVYFNNYIFLEKMIFELNRLGILENIMLNKIILIDNLNKMNLEKIINIYNEFIKRGKSIIIFSVLGRKLEKLIDNKFLNNFILFGNFFKSNYLEDNMDLINYYDKYLDIDKILFSQSLLFEDFFYLTDFLLKSNKKKSIILIDYNHPKKFKYYYQWIKDINYLNIQYKNYNNHNIIKE